MKRRCCKGLVRKVRSYKPMDWALFALATTVVAVVAVFAAAILFSTPKPWRALSYVIPAQVITEDNTISESYSGDDEIPVRITRVMDCVEFTCPNEAIPTLVTARWQLMEDGIAQTTAVTVLEDAPVALIEGESYRPGETLIFTNQLNPFGIPSVVEDHTRRNGGSSDWRIEGEVTPEVPNASPVVWQTQVFTITTEG